jgi:glycerol-3-phosphate dehydrogenase
VGATAPLDERVHTRYGRLKTDIGELIASKPHLGRPVVEDAPYLLAEVAYAVTHEGALHLDDVLTRRTRISIETAHRGVAAAPVVAEVMGEILGWDGDTMAREI